MRKRFLPHLCLLLAPDKSKHSFNFMTGGNFTTWSKAAFVQKFDSYFPQKLEDEGDIFLDDYIFKGMPPKSLTNIFQFVK